MTIKIVSRYQQFKNRALFMGFMLFSCTLYAQNKGHQVTVTKNTNQFYKELTQPIYQQIDTLSNLYQSGTMLVVFTIGKDGVHQVSCTNSAPEILKKITIEALVKMDKKIFSKNAVGDNLYLLPIAYDFAYRGHTLAPLLDRVPSIDNLLQKQASPSDFNLLFDLPSGTPDLVGVKCVFLETIKIKGKIM